MGSEMCIRDSATWLPEKVDCLKDFVEQLKTRQVRPAVWNGSSYDVVDML